jgi:hypothetical protein
MTFRKLATECGDGPCGAEETCPTLWEREGTNMAVQGYLAADVDVPPGMLAVWVPATLLTKYRAEFEAVYADRCAGEDISGSAAWQRGQSVVVVGTPVPADVIPRPEGEAVVVLPAWRMLAVSREMTNRAA